MEHLSIDIETKSSVAISKAGMYKYAQSEDFGILLFAYQEDEGPVEVVDLAQGDRIPPHILVALEDLHITKHAYNAAFEWYCLNRAGYATPLSQWRCTMAHSLYCGYPAGLADTGAAIGLPQDKRKMAVGKALIKYFCTPCKPTKSNGGRTWNLPHHAPEKWELFKDYCKRDVEAEHAILKRLTPFPMPEDEERLWRMTMEMDAFGVRVDDALIKGALAIDGASKAWLIEEARRMTGVDNPNSDTQLHGWLEGRGVPLPNMQKATIAETLKRQDIPDDVRRVLGIRQQTGKTSISKYTALDTAEGSDGRVRGLTQYYGANRTGRWAGRLVQPQNLPRTYLETLDYARGLVRDKDYDGLRLVYGDVPDTLSQLIRTVFIPSDGHKLVVADFSAIEARVIAWLAGEQWVNEVFATHGRIYEATASQMFGVPVERIVKGNPEYDLRQKGKVATLALGYQGWIPALIQMGAKDMGLTEEEMQDIARRWRRANPRICDLWQATGQAAIAAIRTVQPQVTHRLRFALEGDIVYGQCFLTIRLPSGRKLYYPKPFLHENDRGELAPHYYGLMKGTKKWGPISTYGGKLTENIVQAIARDCLAETLKRIDARGLQVVFHVHDEVVIDAPMDVGVEEICGLMAEPIPWAPGLVLKGAGFEGMYYKKD